MGAALYEVIGPHVVRAFRSQPNARAIIEPKPAALWLLTWDFQPFTPPGAFDTFVIHAPTRLPQQCRDPAIAVATVLPSQLDYVGSEPILIFTALRYFALGRAVLTECAAGPALTYAKGLPHTINTQATTRRA